ncbi:winged helix-turn-helix domain-containing protein [Methanolobus chelungpuianus]|uniref:Transcriptional regulator n=1 Tax=Methanolobus chelungpuianus TaxID=502115 RepID=A0AAE3KY49_9EURY|nr:winged helix-turn-helix domain-containing protein [Methanolobus chelungpuianus]MCQ6961748.1 transcriptional regulator [Methanolobus chelungpuianus]
MEDMIGFVTGNKNRQKLLSLLGSKHELDVDRLAKNMHIASPSVKKIIDELLEKGLIKQDNGSYSLTELGDAVEKRVRTI